VRAASKEIAQFVRIAPSVRQTVSDSLRSEVNSDCWLVLASLEPATENGTENVAELVLLHGAV
jgi:hypothetical protein